MQNHTCITQVMMLDDKAGETKEISMNLLTFPLQKRMRKQISRFLFVIIFVWMVHILGFSGTS